MTFAIREGRHPADRVDPHTLGGPGHREALAQSGDAMLGGAVGRRRRNGQHRTIELTITIEPPAATRWSLNRNETDAMLPRLTFSTCRKFSISYSPRLKIAPCEHTTRRASRTAARGRDRGRVGHVHLAEAHARQVGVLVGVVPQPARVPTRARSRHGRGTGGRCRCRYRWFHRRPARSFRCSPRGSTRASSPGGRAQRAQLCHQLDAGARR